MMNLTLNHTPKEFTTWMRLVLPSILDLLKYCQRRSKRKYIIAVQVKRRKLQLSVVALLLQDQKFLTSI